MKRILVPLDGSRLSEAIVPLGEALARDHEADLLLVRALPSRGSPDAEVHAQEEAEAYLRTVAAALAARGRSAEWKVWYDEPARAIADAARYNQADLIVMSTHGRGGLTRLLLGSVAEGVVRLSPVPVLLVRGEGAPARRGRSSCRSTAPTCRRPCCPWWPRWPGPSTWPSSCSPRSSPSPRTRLPS